MVHGLETIEALNRRASERSQGNGSAAIYPVIPSDGKGRYANSRSSEMLPPTYNAPHKPRTYRSNSSSETIPAFDKPTADIESVDSVTEQAFMKQRFTRTGLNKPPQYRDGGEMIPVGLIQYSQPYAK
ncbi:MAG: hypothetical protein Q8O89_07975 [Nanoarchaeota archaeon]|nr:hypothetical protein [Nanoarchaeota archaeon]